VSPARSGRPTVGRAPSAVVGRRRHLRYLRGSVHRGQAPEIRDDEVLTRGDRRWILTCEAVPVTAAVNVVYE